jgi:hypothetical protein
LQGDQKSLKELRLAEIQKAFTAKEKAKLVKATLPEEPKQSIFAQMLPDVGSFMGLPAGK